MRPVLLAAALAAAAFTMPADAATSDCVAHAQPPRYSGGQVYGEGVFGCVTPSTGSLVTVCIDVFWMDNPPGWGPYECSDVRVDDVSQVVVHGLWACAQAGPLVRTTITGTTDDGGTATASSLPVPAPTGSCGP